jgi:hypothetical protein
MHLGGIILGGTFRARNIARALSMAVLPVAILAAVPGLARDWHVAAGAPAATVDGEPERPFADPAAAVAAAAPGDRVLLGPGDYGGVRLEGIAADPPITIQSADPARPARLSALRIDRSSGLSVEGLLVEGARAPEGKGGRPLVLVTEGASDIRLLGLTVRSGARYAGWDAATWRARVRDGVELRGTRNTLADSSIVAVRTGVTVRGPGARVTGNLVDGFSRDGMRGLGDDGWFEGNRIQNCVKVDGNHDDGFQSWSRGADGKSGGGVVRGVVLRDNVILGRADRRLAAPDCPGLHGIGMFDGMYENWLIEGNHIETDAWHGITVMGGINVRIIGNYVSNQTPGLPGPPWTWITLAAHKDGRPGAGNLVEGNRATAFRRAGDHMGTDPRVTVMRANEKLAPIR